MAQNIAKPQPSSKGSAVKPTPDPIIVEAKRLLERMKEVVEAVSKRAYDLFEQRGREVGHEIEDWLHAEDDLFKAVPIDISEVGDELKVRAEVPGFAPNDLQVSVEPRRLIISGKAEKTEEQKTEESVYTECRSNEIFRAIDLPKDVDPAKVTATLKDGVLSLSLAKATISEPIKVEVKAS